MRDTPRTPMAWIVFVALVLGSSVVSYVLRERRHRRRWQLVDLPSVSAGSGAYRESQVAGGHLAEAPGPLRFLVFCCIVYGRAVTFALLATAVYLAGAAAQAIAVPTLHAMVGYFTAGFGVGAIAALVHASMVMRAGSDLLVRDPRGAFRRTRDTALLGLAVHGLVWFNAAATGVLVGVGDRDATQSLDTTRYVAGASAVYSAVMLALVFAYRAALTARRPEAAMA